MRTQVCCCILVYRGRLARLVCKVRTARVGDGMRRLLGGGLCIWRDVRSWKGKPPRPLLISSLSVLVQCNFKLPRFKFPRFSVPQLAKVSQRFFRSPLLAAIYWSLTLVLNVCTWLRLLLFMLISASLVSKYRGHLLRFRVVTCECCDLPTPSCDQSNAYTTLS